MAREKKEQLMPYDFGGSRDQFLAAVGYAKRASEEVIRYSIPLQFPNRVLKVNILPSQVPLIKKGLDNVDGVNGNFLTPSEKS